MVHLNKALIKAMQKNFCFSSVKDLKIHIFKSSLHIYPKYPGFYWFLMENNHLVMNFIIESEMSSSGFGQLGASSHCALPARAAVPHQPLLPTLPPHCSCPSPCCSPPSKGALQRFLKGRREDGKNSWKKKSILEHECDVFLWCILLFWS